ncbi:MAG: EchB [Sulfurovum sp. PC08-66]|nr:MAG: EchB [Sulfurovum sp. PC08-66]KIM12609.1 MAG: EchB [Sulfuricurvum sp. PC08-66]
MVWIVLLAPLWGGFILGAERKIRAHMQHRMGPPLLQPFYDMAKLMQKRTTIIHSGHALLALGYFVTLWIAVGVVLLDGNVLWAIFIHLLASVLLVTAGFSVPSIFSHVGANRELLAIVSYEPILLLLGVAWYVSSGSWESGAIALGGTYWTSMPLLGVALLMVVLLKTGKSPFDMAHAHQEIVGGVEVEYSGIFYEVLYMARFLEYIFIYAFVFLWGGVVAVALFFVLANLIDNATARLTPAQTVRWFYALGLPLALLNLLGLVA